MDEPRLTLKSTNEVVIRMYGQGFGDCFLLALPRLGVNGVASDPANPVYVVIDSGVYPSTPRESERMTLVAKSILAATGGNIELVVATHEHHDHLCGFERAKDTWQKIGVKNVWAAWTEDPNNEFTQIYDHEREALEDHALTALRKLAALAGTDQDKDHSFAFELDTILGLAGFGSVRNPDGQEFLAKAARKLSSGELSLVLGHVPHDVSNLPNVVLSDLTKHPDRRFNPHVPTTVTYCEPSQVLKVPGTDIDTYVLGPPTEAKWLGTAFDESEVYPEAQQGSGPNNGGGNTPLTPNLASALAAASAARIAQEGLMSALNRVVGAPPKEDHDTFKPFSGPTCISYEVAKQTPFFKDRYFSAPPERQIENEWLRGVGRLALQLDDLTNNTSLVLAFRLNDGRVLLFVGDAQVGNWLSWHELKPDKWKRPDNSAVNYRPTAQELLGKTVVYKVGHHGSHNATLKQNGLEMMTDDRLIALVPTSRKLPQINKNPHWEIPWDSMMDALKAKTRGRIVLPHDEENNYTSSVFSDQLERSASELPAMSRPNGEVVERPVRLWHQVRI